MDLDYINLDIGNLYIEKQVYDDHKRIAKSFIWTTKQGIKIPLNSINDSHLSHIIKMLERNKANEKLIKFLKFEQLFRKNYNNIVQEIREFEQLLDIIF